MKALLDVFKYRPLGEHPIVLHKLASEELQRPWRRDEVRLLCPPVDLLMETVNNLARTKAPEILLMPDWPRQAWYQAAIHTY